VGCRGDSSAAPTPTEFGDSLRERCDGAITESESRISEKTHRNVRYVSNPSEVEI